MLRKLLTVLVVVLAFASVSGVAADPASACRDYDGHRNSVVPPSCGSGQLEGGTIHDVVAATWPAELVPTAEQIMYHEGGGIVTDGYCGWGIIESTQAVYGDVTGMSATQCSELAYEIYLDAGGFSPWVTYGFYSPLAPSTPITY